MSDVVAAMRSQAGASLRGRRVLLVEDDYISAEDLREALEREGAVVLGPVPTVENALELLDSGPAPYMAILDINLRGKMVYAVADRLRELDVPFIFATGHDAEAIPPAYADAPRAEKPVDMRDLGRRTGEGWSCNAE